MIKEHSNLLSKFFHRVIEPTEPIDFRDSLDHSLFPVEIALREVKKLV